MSKDLEGGEEKAAEGAEKSGTKRVKGNESDAEGQIHPLKRTKRLKSTPSKKVESSGADADTSTGDGAGNDEGDKVSSTTKAIQEHGGGETVLQSRSQRPRR